ncbi:MAG TPA: Na/Pi cotransporter family protein [Rhodopila sp.]
MLTLVDLAGSVALLLWGVHMVQSGVQRAFGARLRTFLSVALRNRFKAFLAGVGVTAILQSSTATGLMVTGFAAGGLVDLVPALAVMLGANVGTTLIVQLLSFDVAAAAPALVLIGLLLFRKAQAGPRDFGRVLIGLGLVLTALHQFVDLLQPYEAVPGLRQVLAIISTQPLLDVLLAACLTWAAHSSVAVVLVVMSFAAKGVVSPIAAFALVLGTNLGTAINPVLEGATGGNPAGRRLPLGNLANRVLGVALALVFLPWLAPFLTQIDPNAARAVADFHTGFNLVLAIAFFPLLPLYAALLERCLPARIDPADPGHPKYLDPALQTAPVFALGAATREALRLSNAVEAMLAGLHDVLERPDRRRIAEIKKLDDVLDRLNAALKDYVTALDLEGLSDADRRRAVAIMTFSTNMEQAGDVIEKGLLGIATKQVKRGLAFSPEGKRELLSMVERLAANTRAAAAILVTEDPRGARMLAAEKEIFRQLEQDATYAHFERLRSRRIETAETSSLHLDAVRDLKLVNAHLVRAAAYPVLEGQGQLMPSRLRDETGDAHASSPSHERQVSANLHAEITPDGEADKEENDPSGEAKEKAEQTSKREAAASPGLRD